MTFLDELLSSINDKKYFKDLTLKLENEYKHFKVFPSKDNLFNAFKYFSSKQLKVIIFGQDPYYRENQANGLAFAVNKECKTPPSLKNIFKEVSDDFNVEFSEDKTLKYLANQGVLLLNTRLSVKEGEPLSHNFPEYNLLIKDIIDYTNTLNQPIVVLLWGNHAKKYERLFTNNNRLILLANHPSPLSANRGGWFGCKHFSKTNDYLIANNIKPIEWF